MRSKFQKNQYTDDQMVGEQIIDDTRNYTKKNEDQRYNKINKQFQIKKNNYINSYIVIIFLSTILLILIYAILNLADMI